MARQRTVTAIVGEDLFIRLRVLADTDSGSVSQIATSAIQEGLPVLERKLVAGRKLPGNGKKLKEKNE